MRRLHFGRIFSLLGGLLFWVVAIWSMVSLGGAARSRLEQTLVRSVNIYLVDSVQNGGLITSQMVMDMISSTNIVGQKVGSLDYTHIEQSVAQNGFVQSVKVYCTYRGDVHIEVRQRSALARLLVDGYNCYISGDGFIFPASHTTVLYKQVVTGDYPLFVPRGYVGSVDDYMLERIAKIEAHIEQIERERYPIVLRERANYEERGKLKYTSQRMFESRDSYVKRFTELKRSNQRKREVFAYNQRAIERDYAALNKRIEAKRDEQRRVMERCDDIHNLLTLLKHLEGDRFWRDEIVQVVVSEGERGEMRVELSPRSGRFNITLGELLEDHGLVARNARSTLDDIVDKQHRVISGSTISDRSEQRCIEQYRSQQRRLVERDVEAKLERVHYFYDKALERVGWDMYRDINVEFENQIVCKKR